MVVRLLALAAGAAVVLVVAPVLARQSKGRELVVEVVVVVAAVVEVVVVVVLVVVLVVVAVRETGGRVPVSVSVQQGGMRGLAQLPGEQVLVPVLGLRLGGRVLALVQVPVR